MRIGRDFVRLARGVRASARSTGPLSRPALVSALVRVFLGEALATRFPRAAPRSVSLFGNRVEVLDYRSFAYAFHEIFVDRDYELETEEEEPFLIDAGANIGLATLWLKAIAPRARILAFEPDPRTFAVLERNVERAGLAGVELRNAALAAADGRAPLYGDPRVPGALYASLRSEAVDGEDEGRARSEVVGEVDTVRLSPFVDRDVDLLKLDVEGAEHEVIEEITLSGAICRVRRLAAEVRHEPGDPERGLGSFLRKLEEAGLRYELRASSPSGPRGRQNVLVRADRRLTTSVEE